MRSLVTNTTATAKQIRQLTNLLLDEKEHIGPSLGPSDSLGRAVCAEAEKSDFARTNEWS